MLITGRTWIFGSNINTDLIFPKTFFRPSYQPGEMARSLMAGLDPGFAAKIKPGDIIVAGSNFGCGSSREEAAAAMREAGVAAVVASSFSRLFTRNSINFGLPVIMSRGIEEHVSEGETIERALTEGHLRNLTTGFETRLPPMSPESLRMIEDGGIKAYTRRILAERATAAASAQ